MISVIFIILAAICNAAQDTTAHHYSSSIFRNLNPKFWDASISWQNKYYTYKLKIFGHTIEYKLPDAFSDAWHIFKTLFLFFIFAAIVHYKPISANWFTTMTPFAHSFMDWALLGSLHNVVFITCYNKILR